MSSAHESGMRGVETHLSSSDIRPPLESFQAADVISPRGSDGSQTHETNGGPTQENEDATAHVGTRTFKRKDVSGGGDGYGKTVCIVGVYPFGAAGGRTIQITHGHSEARAEIVRGPTRMEQTAAKLAGGRTDVHLEDR